MTLAAPAVANGLTYADVCAGISAATVAWKSLGWRTAFYSEIDKFPCAVLRHHYPDTPNHGDMTRYEEWPDADIDVLIGGTPCQGFSVAGLRKGLDDPRSNLALCFGRIAQRYQPRWIVWENVPDVRSSWSGSPPDEEITSAGWEGDESSDFAAFLGGLAELGYGLAWRSFDAQYAGLAQRRERVFVVGYLGDWRRAAAVLFEPESLRWHPAPRREARQGTAQSIGGGPDGGSISGAVTCKWVKGSGGPAGDECYTLSASRGSASAHAVAHSLRADGFDASEDGTGRGTPIVPVAYRVHGEHSVAMTGGGIARVADPAEVARALDTNGGYATNQGGNVVMQPLAFSCKDHGADAPPLSPTLRAMGHDGSHANAGGQVAVAFNLRGREDGAQPEADPDNLASLRAASGGSSRSYVAQQWAVRRLTPVECERLMGMPDGYTAIPWRGKPAEQCPDGPRYKALGNSIAVPELRWIGQRIELCESVSAELEARAA